MLSELCATTGRPALMAGGGVSFAVEKMPPAKAIKFRNPDGDGEYKVTLTNPTNAPWSTRSPRWPP